MPAGPTAINVRMLPFLNFICLLKKVKIYYEQMLLVAEDVAAEGKANQDAVIHVATILLMKIISRRRKRRGA